MAETTPVDGLIHFDAGLIPVVAQDDESDEVLLLAYMNEAALHRTLIEGVLVLWSRSRRRLWRKGEQSGNTLRLVELRLNCEGNSLLARVRLEGLGACHDGYRSCYYRRLEVKGQSGQLRAIVDREPVFDPANVYGHAPTFEREARTLYRAYEQLRDAPLDSGSATSRLLHRTDREVVSQLALKRAWEELAELEGVIDGTHQHRNRREDVILEASQVGYWTFVAAVARQIIFDDWRPDLRWLGGEHGEVAAEGAKQTFGRADCGAAFEIMAGCWSLLVEAGQLCRRAGVDPSAVVGADLASMRAKHQTPAGMIAGHAGKRASGQAGE